MLKRRLSRESSHKRRFQSHPNIRNTSQTPDRRIWSQKRHVCDAMRHQISYGSANNLEPPPPSPHSLILIWAVKRTPNTRQISNHKQTNNKRIRSRENRLTFPLVSWGDNRIQTNHRSIVVRFDLSGIFNKISWSKTNNLHDSSCVWHNVWFTIGTEVTYSKRTSPNQERIRNFWMIQIIHRGSIYIYI